jgi:creatinine amidohydrolase/Fe(II)-dependent formamide hydrolase-like protein
MYLADETWPELGDYFADESLALVPLGSTEQHGPHLPLATDHLIAEAFAREAADRTGYLCTPTINVGVSPHHRQFHGTMWVDAPQFRDYVESFTRNLAYHGIDRVVYVNAHGGNVDHLREVGRRLRDDEVMYAIEWIYLLLEKIVITLGFEIYFCNVGGTQDGSGQIIQRKEEKMGRLRRGKSPANPVSANPNCHGARDCSGQSAGVA